MKRNKPIPHNCVICGKEIPITKPACFYNKQRTCSRTCQYQLIGQRNAVILKGRRCNPANEFKKGHKLIRTKEHGQHISEAKKGIRTSIATEFKEGQHSSTETEFKKWHTALYDKISKQEYKIRAQLTKAGYIFETNVKTIIGTPDIHIPSKRLLIFVDGCFWHSCQIHNKYFNAERYPKLAGRIANGKKRDSEVIDILIKEGYNIIRIWEHDVNKESFDIEKVIQDEANKNIPIADGNKYGEHGSIAEHGNT